MSIQRLPSLPVYNGEVEEDLRSVEAWWEENSEIIAAQIDSMDARASSTVKKDWMNNAFKVSGCVMLIKKIAAQVRGATPLEGYQERVELLLRSVKAQDATLKDLLSQMENKESRASPSPLRKTVVYVQERVDF